MWSPITKIRGGIGHSTVDFRIDLRKPAILRGILGTIAGVPEFIGEDCNPEFDKFDDCDVQANFQNPDVTQDDYLKFAEDIEARYKCVSHQFSSDRYEYIPTFVFLNGNRFYIESSAGHAHKLMTITFANCTGERQFTAKLKSWDFMDYRKSINEHLMEDE